MFAHHRGAAGPDGRAGRELGGCAAGALSLGLLALGLMAGFVPGAATAGACAPPLAARACAAITDIDTVMIAEPGGQSPLAVFAVEVAASPQTRAQGLMHRAFLPEDAAMLFAYPSEKPVSFWMRNTLLPLDMLFIDAQGQIVYLHENARPLDETPINSGQAVRFVLEINGGLSRRLGLRLGMQVLAGADCAGAYPLSSCAMPR